MTRFAYDKTWKSDKLRPELEFATHVCEGLYYLVTAQQYLYGNIFAQATLPRKSH